MYKDNISFIISKKIAKFACRFGTNIFNYKNK